MARRYDLDGIHKTLRRKQAEGLTYQELSELTGIPHGTLAGWQRRYGAEQELFTEYEVPEGEPATPSRLISPAKLQTYWYTTQSVRIPAGIDDNLYL